MAQDNPNSPAAGAPPTSLGRALATLDGDRAARRAALGRAHATPPFLAQLISDRLARRRLGAARDAASNVHASYKNARTGPRAPGRRVDVSI